MRDWLAEIRKAAGKSQRDVADEAGMSQSYYAAIESGARGVKSLNVNYAKAMGVDYTLFDNMTPQERQTYNYYYSQSRESANDYMQQLRPILQYRQAQALEQQGREWAGSSVGGALGASAFSVLSKPMEAGAYIGQTIDMATTGKVNENAAYNLPVRFNAAIREQVTQDKMRAFANADELLQASRDYVGEELKHTRRDNIVEFARGVVDFRVGENGYTADIIVGTKKDGSAILYDVVQLGRKTITEAPISEASGTGAPVTGDAALSAQPRRQGDTLQDVSTAGRRNDDYADYSLFDSGEVVNPQNADVAPRATQGETRQTSQRGVPEAEQGLVLTPWVRTHIDSGTINSLNQFAKAMGVQIEFVPTVTNAAGKAANGVNRERYIQIAQNAQNPMMQVIGHEIGHQLARMSPEAWQRFMQALPDSELAKAEHKLKTYREANEWIDADLALEEVACDYAGELVYNEGMMRDFLQRNRDDRTLLEKFRDAIHNFASKLTGAPRSKVRTAEQLLMEALESGEENKGSAVEGDGQARWQLKEDYNPETASIKQQIENSREKLNSMNVVANATVPINFKYKRAALQWAMDRLKSSGYQVDRQGFGVIYFSESDIKNALNYSNTAEEQAALAVLPQVLKRGIEIGEHSDHKGRGKQTITFAAPVVLNGQRGNMAVVVNKNGNHFYAHRIILPDGSSFVFSAQNENAVPTAPRGVAENSSLAKDISTASESRIPDSSEDVKGGSGGMFSLMEGEDSQGRKLSPQQEEYFRDSQVRDEEGRLLVVYHGSPAQFTEFSHRTIGRTGSAEGRGFYFTDNRSAAEGYQRDGGQLLAGYLDIQKPLSLDSVTLTEDRVSRLLRDIDPIGDDLIINYAESSRGYPSIRWYESAVANAVSMIMESCESDADIMAEIANAGAGNKAVMLAAKKLFGYDGYIAREKYDGASVFVAFESNQFKNIDNTTPTTDQDVRFSLMEGEQRQGAQYSSEALRKNADEVRTMQPVSELTGKEFPKGAIPLKDQVLAFFQRLGGVVHSDELGDVRLSKNSWRSELRHGLTTEKGISFAAIPDVIQRGKVIDVYSPNGANYDRIVVAAPVSIGGERYYMGVMLHKDRQSQRLYLHDVVTENGEDVRSHSQTRPAADGSQETRSSTHLLLTNILQNALFGNSQSESAAPEATDSGRFSLMEDQDSQPRKASTETKQAVLSAIMDKSSYPKLEAAMKQGIPLEAVMDAKLGASGFKNGKDADGNDIKGEEKKWKVFAYIDSIPGLTSAQKDCLVLRESEGGCGILTYVAKTIAKEAPWHGGSRYTGKLPDHPDYHAGSVTPTTSGNTGKTSSDKSTAVSDKSAPASETSAQAEEPFEGIDDSQVSSSNRSGRSGNGGGSGNQGKSGRSGSATANIARLGASLANSLLSSSSGRRSFTRGRGRRSSSGTGRTVLRTASSGRGYTVLQTAPKLNKVQKRTQNLKKI